MLFKKNVCVLVLLCCKVVLSIKKTAVSLDETAASNKKCLKTDGRNLKAKVEQMERMVLKLTVQPKNYSVRK
jgi:hypothetical protein